MNNGESYNHLEFVCKIISETLRIPVLLLDENKGVVLEVASPDLQNPLLVSRKELMRQINFEDDESDAPVLRTTNILENFISLKVSQSQAFTGIIVVGPSIYGEVSDEIVTGLINDLRLNVDKNALKRYYQSLPVINKLRLLNIGLLVYYMIYNKQLDLDHIVQKNIEIESLPLPEVNPDLQLTQIRQELSFHDHLLYEKNVMQCIREGRTEDLIKLLKLAPEEKFGVLSKKSYLRSKKNLAICGIALGTRAAIEGGLHQEVAYTVSDVYIQTIEELSQVDEVNQIMNKGLVEFAERVKASNKNKYSKPIAACLDYIYKHLYEKTTLLQLASHVKMNPSYLSTLFKKRSRYDIK